MLTGEFPPMQGGVGDYTWRLGEALAEESIEVSVLTGRRSSGHFLEWGQLTPRVGNWEWGMSRQVLRTVEELEPHILHIQYQAAAYALHPAINFLPWRLRVRRGRPKVVATFHDLRVPYLFPKAGRLRDWVVKLLARGSDAAIFTNQEDMERAKNWGKVRSYLIPIGSNISLQLPPRFHREEWREALGVAPGDTLLCHFGLLNASKGVDTLFEALKRLRSEDQEAKLLMVGGRTGESDPTNLAYAERIEALRKKLGVEEAILWTGFIPPQEVSAHLVASDICVLPFRDGASLRRGSLMAALEHGLAIVSTQPPSIPRELREGQNITLVPPDDPTALAERITQLARDPDLRKRLREGARELSAGFSWGAIAQQNAQIYKELVGHMGRGEPQGR